MGKRVLLLVLVSLATLQVFSAMGLDKMPFPDWMDIQSDTPVNVSAPLSTTWEASTQWLGALRSSYSQILRYETNDTLARMTHFVDNIQTGTLKYKEKIGDILKDKNNTRYMNCTRTNKLKRIQEAVLMEDRELQRCAAPLKKLHYNYARLLDSLTTQIEARSEETIYKPCVPTAHTVTLINSGLKCFYANLQDALSSFYHPLGTTVLRTVGEFRIDIAHARDEAYTCATASDANGESMTRGLDTIVSCLEPSPGRVRRGISKSFKKVIKKITHAIDKVCNMVECQYTHTSTFG